MIYKSIPVNAACLVLIVGAVLASPIWLAAVLGGMVTDRYGQRRHRDGISPAT